MLTSNRVDLIDNKVPFGFGIDSSTGEYGYVKQGQSTVTSFGGSGTEIALDSITLDSIQLKSFKQQYTISIDTQFGESSTERWWYRNYGVYSNSPVVYKGRIYGVVGKSDSSSYTSFVRTLDNMDYGTGKLWKETGWGHNPGNVLYAACDDDLYYLITGSTSFLYRVTLDDSFAQIDNPPISSIDATVGYQSSLHLFGYKNNSVHYAYINESWSYLDMLPERQYGLCIKFRNKFFIGTVLGKLYVYDLTSNIYTLVAATYRDSSTSNYARFEPMYFSTWNNDLYIRFKDTSSSTLGTYRIEENNFAEKISSPSKPMNANGGVIIKNRLVDFSTTDMKIYDPETDSWTDPSIEMLMIYNDNIL